MGRDTKAKWSLKRGTYIQEPEEKKTSGKRKFLEGTKEERRKAAEEAYGKLKEAMSKRDRATGPDEEERLRKARRKALEQAGYKKYK